MRPPDNRLLMLAGWLFRRRARHQHARELAEIKRILDFDERVREGGYRPIIGCLPPLHKPIEVIRFEWPESHFIKMDEQSPQTDIAGLYWREP